MFGRCFTLCAKYPVRTALLIGLTAFFLGGGIFSLAETNTSFIDGLYWTTVVMPTVGFGDFSPHTEIGRLTYEYVWISGKIADILLFGAFAGMVAQRRLEEERNADVEGTADLDDDIGAIIAAVVEHAEQTTQDLLRLKRLTDDPRVEAALAECHEDQAK